MACKGVSLRRVEIRYPGSPRPAARVPRLEAGPGELVVLVGPNGGGKTSILRAIAGAIPGLIPGRVEGEVSVCGLDPRRDPVYRLVQYMGQDPKSHVVGATGLLEAAATPLLWGLPGREALSRAVRALRSVGALHLAGRPTNRMSGGELQRVAAAGVLSAGPRVLLLDEPLSHVDWEGRRVILETVEEALRSGAIVVAATHGRELVERASRVYLVEGEARPLREWSPPPCRAEPPPARPGRVAAWLRDAWARYAPGLPPALRGASVEARWGELVVLVGPNGGGKTSILLALAGLLDLERGESRAEEGPVLVPQDPLLLFSGGTLREAAPGPLPEWALSLADRPVFTLSWGELRLAALALAVSSGRRIILADEPTSGLDPWNACTVIRHLSRLAAEGASVIVATHDPRLAAAASRAYWVEAGRAWPCSGGCSGRPRKP